MIISLTQQPQVGSTHFFNNVFFMAEGFIKTAILSARWWAIIVNSWHLTQKQIPRYPEWSAWQTDSVSGKFFFCAEFQIGMECQRGQRPMIM